jgi:5-methyltetrahydrofolate--homocysteine methyltransferase
MLKKIIDNKWLEARAIVGFYPANTVHTDDIELYSPDGSGQVVTTLHTLRQQSDRGDSDAFLAMSDFIAPKESGI